MRPIETVEVPANAQASLKPGGDHIMLMGLDTPLKEGDSFPMTLTFEVAGNVSITVPVKKATAMSADE